MNTAESWREVGAKLEAIGLKLKLHYEEEHDVEPAEERKAVDRFVDAIDDAFDALGNAAEDDAVRSDVRDAGQALTNALAATFADVSRSARDTFAGRETTSATPTVADETPAADEAPVIEEAPDDSEAATDSQATDDAADSSQPPADD